MEERPEKPWTIGRHRRRYRLTNATLIDPKDGQVYHQVTLDLKDGIVHRMTDPTHAATPADEFFKWTHGPDCTVVNLAGKFVVPGLIDCHVNLAAPPGEKKIWATIEQDPSKSLLRQTYLAAEMLKRGFTTVRDCGGAGSALKEAISEGLVVGPRLYICGHRITPTGGYTNPQSRLDEQCVQDTGRVRSLCRFADGVSQCLHAAREELGKGADFLHITVSATSVIDQYAREGVQYTPEEIRAFTQVAEHAKTKYVTAHADTPEAIRHAIENGITSIEHGAFIDEATARLMATKGVMLTPALISYQVFTSEEVAAFVADSFIPVKSKETLRASLEGIKVADKAGVEMCYGSDLYGPLQGFQTGEFALRKAAGLSSLKILQSATVNAARLLRQEDKLGRIKLGSAADLIILNRNPLEDIEVLDRPNNHLLAVMKDGRVVASRWSQLPKEVDVASLIE